MPRVRGATVANQEACNSCGANNIQITMVFNQQIDSAKSKLDSSRGGKHTVTYGSAVADKNGGVIGPKHDAGHS